MATDVIAVLEGVTPGSTIGVGSLPHRSAVAAVEFSVSHFDLPVVPRLPRRSAAEALVAQSMVGFEGIEMGPYGAVAVDTARLDPEAPVVTDLRRDNFGGFRAFLDVAPQLGVNGRTVKWQFVGPITLGLTLARAGAPVDVAFRQAVSTVRSHVSALGTALRSALPDSEQLVVIDEPLMVDLMAADFPLPPDAAADVLSSAMVAAQPFGTVGLHCCFDADWPSLLEAGPQVLSLPASAGVAEVSGYLDRFMDGGGRIAWGAVSTEGPIGVTASRSWHALSSLWCEMVKRGSDPGQLRLQSLLSPQSGLASYSPAVAEGICRSLRDISQRVRDQASAAKLVLGA
jgi:hypothetical protein